MTDKPRKSRRSRAVACVSLVAALSWGCQGVISGSAEGSGSGASGGSGPKLTGERPQRFVCSKPELRGRGQRAMRRLTRDELLNSVAALVGTSIMSAEPVQRAAAQIPSESPGDLVATFQNGHAFDHVQGLLLTSQAVAAEVANNAAVRDQLFGKCAAQADETCAASFLDTTALRILRRPLEPARRELLLAGFRAEGAGSAGMQWLLARLWQAPEAVFHLELARQVCAVGTSSCTDEPAKSGMYPIDDWSVASRVSYAITGEAPDEELLQAAGRGELRTEEQVRPHAERLLASTAARRQLEAVLDSWLGLNAIPTPHAALAKLAGIDATGLAEEARQELLDYAKHLVLDRDADVTSLLSARVGFPKTPRMAKLYGSSVVSGSDPVELGRGHGGLLLRLAPLLSGQLSSSPILRGVYVRKRLLCDTLPSPDFTIVNSRVKQFEAVDHTKFSTREIVTQITSDSVCATCHVQINPLGFALERFDPLGQPRTEEIVFDATGAELGRHPIDDKVTAANLEQGAPTVLNGAEALNAALGGSAKVRACIAERFYSQARLRPTTDADACALAAVEVSLRNGGSVRKAWLAAIVNPELFVRQVEEMAP